MEHVTLLANESVYRINAALSLSRLLIVGKAAQAAPVPASSIDRLTECDPSSTALHVVHHAIWKTVETLVSFVRTLETRRGTVPWAAFAI